MARREMRWFRFLCEGRRRGGSICESMILVCAVDEGLADTKAIDDYEWHKAASGEWFCDLTHLETA